MAKIKTVFVCQQCGYQSAKWLGRCPDCDNWNTLTEETQVAQDQRPLRQFSTPEPPQSLLDVEACDEIRQPTRIKELDRILGGGIVSGSVVLVGGEPGIGKSTLLLQTSRALASSSRTVLYVSGEESLRQTKLRATRLGEIPKDLYIVSETNVDLIAQYIKKFSPAMVVIDSIQVMYNPLLTSSPGSVSQVRECSGLLTSLAKASNIPVFLVGHVTKEGFLAGPRVLEHMVDTVLYFEGQRHTSFRILRAVKNRFGSTNEIGVFQMTGLGLAEVTNPSQLFLSERPKKATGSVVVPCIEGTRPLLLEIQALVSRSSLVMPRRWCSGLDYNRIALLIAVLEKRVGLSLSSQDIFVNVVGGVKIQEPAIDLGIAVAIASSLKEVPVEQEDIILGEIGLSAEVRAVTRPEPRILEAQRLGFKRCIIAKNNLKELKVKGPIELIGVETVSQALEAALKK
ncbi:MAG: DNA repair protein RadA [Candidatus Omnitrophica bacterium]|nr:DNA repair protein RadA [Candidatus Omnitrophota bacterium]MBU3934135.1 DNA repair protein RadA [Candidatus Omnitrophota bacterium]MBU4140786.1 DNA repair protein RadA [Candidatus Omnitrophota bacterium]